MRQSERLLLSTLFVIFLMGPIVGCGSSMQIQPLIGEEPEHLALLETSPDVLLVDAPTATARALLVALQDKNYTQGWAFLSQRTQDALVKRFASQEAERGPDILLRLAGLNQNGEANLSPIQLLFRTTPTSLRSYSPEEEPSLPSARAPTAEATVFAYTASGQAIRLRFILDQNQWKLDTTRFP